MTAKAIFVPDVVTNLWCWHAFSGTSLVNVPPGYIGYEQQVTFAELDWVVSRRMEGTINSANWHFPIYQTLPDYSTVNIKPTQSPLILFLLGSACNDG